MISSCARVRPSAEPEETPPETEGILWTAEELEQDIAIRKLSVAEDASYHVGRIRTQEKPHLHHDHDLSVYILTGEVLVHFGNRKLTLMPGMGMDIPRGMTHWAENRHHPASEAYLIFSPAFEGTDHHFVQT